jgi:hypothetical protein
LVAFPGTGQQLVYKKRLGKMLKFPTGKKHISYSEFRMWKECTYRHFLTHVERVDDTKDENPTLAFGTSMHKFCELYFSTRDHTESIKSAITEFESAWESGLRSKDKAIFTEKERKRCITNLINFSVDIPEWFDEKFPGWKLIATEAAIMTPVDEEHGTDGYSFKGFIDIVIEYDGDTWILDWKTSNKGWSSSKRNDELTHKQLQMYAAYYESLGLPLTGRVRGGFVILNRSAELGDRSCDLVEINLDETKQHDAKKSIKHMLKVIERGISIKDKSACFFCPYAKTEHCPLSVYL